MRILFQPMILSAGAAAALVLAPLVAVDIPRGMAPFSLPAAAQAQDATEAEQSRRITVTGTGQVDLPPDMATVRIGVTQQDEAAAAALQQTSDALAAMLERLEGLGVAERDVQTSGLRLNPVWRDSPDRSEPQGQPEPWGFEASNMVTVRLRDLEQLGAVLDALVSDGANRLDGVSFGLQEPEVAQDEARRLAVAEARRKAALYAEAAGVTLGHVVSLSETGANRPQPQMMETALMRAGSVPVAAGEVAIEAAVQMVFELQ